MNTIIENFSQKLDIIFEGKKRKKGGSGSPIPSRPVPPPTTPTPNPKPTALDRVKKFGKSVGGDVVRASSGLADAGKAAVRVGGEAISAGKAKLGRGADFVLGPATPPAPPSSPYQVADELSRARQKASEGPLGVKSKTTGFLDRAITNIENRPRGKAIAKGLDIGRGIIGGFAKKAWGGKVSKLADMVGFGPQKNTRQTRAAEMRLQQAKNTAHQERMRAMAARTARTRGRVSGLAGGPERPPSEEL